MSAPLPARAYRNLGASGLKVSPLWLGTMMFGDQTAEAEAWVDARVPPGHASTFGYTDPVYPVTGRAVP